MSKAKPPVKPDVKRVVITKAQADVMAQHEATIANAVAHRNSFLSGVLTGHGYASANVTDFDPEKRTLTFTVLPSEAPAP